MNLIDTIYCPIERPLNDSEYPRFRKVTGQPAALRANRLDLNGRGLSFLRLPSYSMATENLDNLLHCASFQNLRIFINRT